MIIVVIGVTSWPGTARLSGAKHCLWVLVHPSSGARALGGSNWHQMRKHVLPNVMPLVLANTTLAVSISRPRPRPHCPSSASGTPRQCRGVDPGDCVRQRCDLAGAWWYLAAPGICVVLVVVAFNLMGRAIEGILDLKEETG